MRNNQLLRAITLIASIPIFSVASAATAHSVEEMSYRGPECSASSTENSCHRTMLRAQANQAAWQSADLRLFERRGEPRRTDRAGVETAESGDLVFDNVLLDASGVTVGRFLSRCVQLTDAMHRCEGGLLFADGTIQLSTVTSFGGEISAAVIGGTGRYAGSNGEAVIMPTDEADKSAIAVDLR